MECFGRGGGRGELGECVGSEREFYRSGQTLVMIRLKYLSPSGLPFLCHPIVIPHVVRRDRGEKCDRESMEVQLLDEVADHIGPSTDITDFIEDVAC